MKYPIQTINKKSILITNNKGGTINVLILKINELFPNFEIIKVINWKYYQTHKVKYQDYWKLSDNYQIADENKGFYLNLSFFPTDMSVGKNAKAKLTLIKKIIASSLTTGQKMSQIREALTDFE
ncbi:hypothetical protein [Spiroplasma sp. SV19]|uniref:hypothetical protein n=1 Tax=Spiroplasma sp. SV19 TaxID=2570468 RepID=UPI0024B65806|nr:hypothetical protein [Spiroplasma sp. SV19]WHQ37123.1 hypothetical protein E7Y35_04425 [Spiroplasma sp. SV19]